MLFTAAIKAHSFLTCSNYDEEKQECCGFPNNYDLGYLQTGLLGYDFQNSGTDLKCKDGQDTADANYPAAQVKAGGDLILTWPPQNHAKDGTGSSPRMDTVFLYENDSGTPKKIAEMNYQNCDASGSQTTTVCSGKFTVDLPVGEHDLIWAWELNEGFYTTCFKVEVTDAPENSVCVAMDGKPPKAEAGTASSGSPIGESATESTEEAAPEQMEDESNPDTQTSQDMTVTDSGNGFEADVGSYTPPSKCKPKTVTPDTVVDNAEAEAPEMESQVPMESAY